MRPLPPAAGGVLRYFTRHRTAANLLLVVLVVLGAAAFPQLRAQFFPDVVVDDVTVSVRWDGAGAEDVDTAIVAVLEPSLLAVEGVESSEATSREGRASIELEFEPGWDMARAADDVQQAVDSATELPQDAEDPVVRRGAWRDRVTDVVITGPVAPQQLGRIADEMTARLFAVGVTRTAIRGISAPQTVVEVPSAALIRHDVSLSQIANAIGSEAATSPAGDVDAANARIRTGGADRSPQALAAIVLRSNPDGSSLTVGDVASIRVEGVTRERAYFVGSDPAVSLRVDRSERGDAIAIQQQVEAVAEAMRASLPQGVSIDLIRTRAEYISGRLDILLDNGLLGLGLVVLLLFLFLNARTAFWVAAGIPTAMLAAIAFMYAAGLTINMISLFALIITLGIVVDDAIVVGEHADFRARRLGEDAATAAENAARRMAAPVFSATLTTVLAFAGLVAVGGRFGSLIADIPYTVIAVLIASLIECFLILPNHMAHALKTRGTQAFSRARVVVAGVSVLLVSMLLAVVATTIGAWVAWKTGLSGTDTVAALLTTRTLAVAAAAGAALPLLSYLAGGPSGRAAMVAAMSDHGIDTVSGLVNRGFSWLRDRGFRPLMRIVVWARYPVLAGMVAVLCSQAALFVTRDVQWRFFNSPEQSSVTGNFAMLDGASRADTVAMMREMQRATQAVAGRYEAEHGTSPLVYVLAEIGGNTGRGLAAADDKPAELLGSIAIELIEADARPYSSFAFVADLQDEVQRHPMAEEVSFRGWRGGPGGDAIDIQLFGADSATLKDAAQALIADLSGFPEVSALQDSLAYDREELLLELTPQGEALGFEIGELGRILRDRLNGIEAATYPDGVRTAAIRVALPEGELTADFLELTMLRSDSGQYVPLADIVGVDSRTGFATIQRENGIRVVTVSGDLSEDDPARATEVMDRLEQAILPAIAADHGVQYRLSGLSEQEDAFLSDAMTGFALCLLGIYLVLAWIFASWTRPMVVMAIIPFGLVGTIFGHWVWDVPLSLFTVVGLIGMTGIIINDSIVLVTTIDEYAEDRGILQAIADGAADRLRPVLLTTLTTVLGLMPLLYEGSQQAQFLKPTVITLVYGLGFGMAIVLFLVPALMAVQMDVGRRLRALRRAMGGRVAGAGALVGLAAVGIAGTFAATVGVQALTGTMPAPLAGLGVPAFALFVAGAFGFVVLFALIGAVVLPRRRAPV